MERTRRVAGAGSADVLMQNTRAGTETNRSEGAMEMQRWEPWTNWDEASDMREDDSGSYVLYADAMERERVLREFVEGLAQALESSNDCTRSDTRLIEEARADLILKS